MRHMAEKVAGVVLHGENILNLNATPNRIIPINATAFMLLEESTPTT
jgi:hypothetical protein